MSWTFMQLRYLTFTVNLMSWTFMDGDCNFTVMQHSALNFGGYRFDINGAGVFDLNETELSHLAGTLFADPAEFSNWTSTGGRGWTLIGKHDC